MQPNRPPQWAQAPQAADAGAVDLLIVIVNYRTPGLTIDCLHSLAQQTSSPLRLRAIVVDNGSGDDSACQISQAIDAHDWSSWVTLHATEANLGFAGGNNAGIQLCPGARYVLLLNSDTIVRPGCLSYCLQVMEREPEIGALSCRLLTQDGQVQNVARRFPTPTRQILCALGLPWKLPRLFAWADIEDLGWDRGQFSRNVDWLGGAFLMIRGSALRAVGLLDDDFFFTGEDIEFCHRLHRAGYLCRYDPGASITHLGGSSSEPSYVNPHRRAARYLVQLKLYSPAAALTLRMVDQLMIIVRRARQCVRPPRSVSAPQQPSNSPGAASASQHPRRSPTSASHPGAKLS